LSWNLITDEWRLKLLALGLAGLMLGAVAFSQNPPTSKDLTVSIAYNIPQNSTPLKDSHIIVINPPTTTKVRVTGLADAIAVVNSNSVAATFDLSKATPGQNVHADLLVHPVASGVQVVNTRVPYTLNIDKLDTVKLEVLPRVTRQTQGWQVDKQEAICPGTPCQVSFTGPASWETNLKAFVLFTVPIENSSYNVPTQPVILERNGLSLDISHVNTEPAVSVDPLTVEIHITAHPTIVTRQMVLIDAQPVHGPAPGYHVTNVAVNPTTVVITGPPDVLARITTTTITLPAVDLSSKTSDYKAQVAIPYPDGTSGSVGAALVTYSISPNPAASP
jgi:YbbR domain-containing protein